MGRAERRHSVKGEGNPSVPAGTKNTAVVHGVCHDCSRRTLLGATSRVCTRCWVKRVERDEALVEAMEQNIVRGTE